MEVRNLPNKEFKETIVRMLTKLENGIEQEEHQQKVRKYNKGPSNMKNN